MTAKKAGLFGKRLRFKKIGGRGVVRHDDVYCGKRRDGGSKVCSQRGDTVI